MRKVMLTCALFLALWISPAVVSAGVIVLDFESLNDLDPVTTQFPGLTFENATVLVAGLSLNEIDFPPHSGTNVIFDDGSPLTVSFATPLLSVGGYFTYLSGLTLQAYDSNNSLLGIVSSAFTNNTTGLGNLGSAPNEFLSITSSVGISRITIAGDPSGGSFVLDDFTLTTQPPVSSVPEPSTFSLFMPAVALALRPWRGRARR